MAKVLMATVPFMGHVYQALPLARKLTERGHDVLWYTGSAFTRQVESTGARYLAMRRAPDFGDRDLDEVFPGRRGLSGLAKLKYELKHVFIDAAPGQIGDLTEVLDQYHADVLLTERAFVGASALHELGGPPWAAYGISILPFSSRDCAPIGLGLPPSRSPQGRLRNHALNWLCNDVLFRDVAAHANQVRSRLGLPPLQEKFLDAGGSAYLYLQPTTPAFEYPRSDLPPQVHFIGPLLDEPPTDFSPPTWWSDLASPRPVVFVSQGTVQTDPKDLVLPAVRALAGEDVLVVVAANVPTTDVPANARVTSFVPYREMMPFTNVFVSNGGYVGVQTALAHGVPVVMAGRTEEKAEIGRRVAWSGVGLDLRAQRPQPDQIRAAVLTVLRDGGYRANARRVQADFARHDAPAEAVALIERLIATGEPVMR